MAAGTEPIGPPSTSLGPIGWVRRNLLSTWANSLLTVLSIALLYLLLKGVLGWVFFTADWSAVTSNVKVLLVGQYPSDQVWRIGLNLLLGSFVLGLSWGVWGGVARNLAIGLAVVSAGVALVPVPVDGLGLGLRLWLIASPSLTVLGHRVTRTWEVRPRWVILAWPGWFALGILGLGGLPGGLLLSSVSTGLWGGLMLTFILALVGIVACFPIGVLLALGRRSNLPLVKALSVLFIELVRGVPLVTLLFMSLVITPLIMPQGVIVDLMLRALIAITLFSAAYMAENVRGGLQAIPWGQVEAARALGLKGYHVTFFIVLPQALRAVLPAIVGQFISLFKDTSLVVTVGLLDLLGIGRSIIQGNVQWLDNQAEMYLFLALVYWVFTYSMSSASRSLETRLGVGER